MTDAPAATWVATAATQLGSAHARSGTANQDAYAVGGHGPVRAVAVADGHGHPSHFRSGRGARLAADLAVDLAVAVPGEDSPGDPTRTLTLWLEEELRPELIDAWRRRVLDHHESTPFSPEEEARAAGDDDEAVLRAYGTTLILMVATPSALGFAQLGDGDAVATYVDGETVRPLPRDSRLDGVSTTSMYQDDAARSMRIGTMPTGERPIGAAFVATDGFGGSQVDGTGWWLQVGSELVDRLRQHGPDWICDKLPGWLSEPARIGGDDTTMGVLMNTGATRPSS